VAQGQLSTDRIDEAVQHILALKIRMGLIPLPIAGTTPTPRPALPSPTPSATALVSRP
jgi:beta-glucosidase-like glycosyl hydrolase